MDNYFINLSKVPCKGHTEKKGDLDYLSWGYAWQMLKEQHPDATFTIYENADGWFYHTDGRTAWVKTGVTVNGIEHIECLPVMDNQNKSVPINAVTSVIVNKTIQRSITKAIARHGLGISLYTGDFSDLPEAVEAPEAAEPCDSETYWRIVTKAADGEMAKSGTDYRTAFIQNMHPSVAALEKFDHDVELRQAAIGKQPQTHK